MSKICKWCKKPTATVEIEANLAPHDSGNGYCWRDWNQDVECYQIEERMKDAAPDLLEALEEAEKYLVERGIEIRGFTGRTIILPKIRAAIAKATGKEQP